MRWSAALIAVTLGACAGEGWFEITIWGTGGLDITDEVDQIVVQLKATETTDTESPGNCTTTNDSFPKVGEVLELPLSVVIVGETDDDDWDWVAVRVIAKKETEEVFRVENLFALDFRDERDAVNMYLFDECADFDSPCAPGEACNCDNECRCEPSNAVGLLGLEDEPVCPTE